MRPFATWRNGSHADSRAPLFWRAILVTLVTLFSAQPLFAHGGGVARLTRVEVGSYLLYAWSDPPEPRAGDTIHITVGITKPETTDSERPITDAVVTIIARSNDGQVVTVDAAPGAAGGVFYEADLTLASGAWAIDVDIAPAQGSGGSAQFSMQVQEASAIRSWLIWLGIAGILVGTALYGIAILQPRRKAAAATS